MKTATLFVCTTVSSAMAREGLIDLTSLHEYANQARPDYIVKDNTPDNNRITNIGATRRQVLFNGVGTE